MSGVLAENISYSYPGASAKVLDGVSFSAECGKVTALIGANGTGKSTLLKNMLGICHGDGRV